MHFIFAEFSPPAKSPSGHAQGSGSGETSVQGREQTPPAAAASRSPPQLETAAAVTSPADDTAPAAAARSERGDSETSQSQGSDVLPDHTEFDAAEFDHDDADADAGDAGFQCSSCSSKFMSETSMRIHTVQCKSRHSELLQNRYSAELQFIVLSHHQYFNFFILIRINCRDVEASQDHDSDVVMEDSLTRSPTPTKQTPIKSWLKKHMDSEKSPERDSSSTMKTSPNLPQYIIPLVHSFPSHTFDNLR